MEALLWLHSLGVKLQQASFPMKLGMVEVLLRRCGLSLEVALQQACCLLKLGMVDVLLWLELDHHLRKHSRR